MSDLRDQCRRYAWLTLLALLPLAAAMVIPNMAEQHISVHAAIGYIALVDFCIAIFIATIALYIGLGIGVVCLMIKKPQRGQWLIGYGAALAAIIFLAIFIWSAAHRNHHA